MPRRLLLIVTSPDPKEDVLERAKERVRSQAADQDVEILVVAPASDVSFLDWLASDVDAARGAAAHRARDSADAEREAHGGTVVGAKVGDVDPLTAVGDALRTFDADEIVVVTRPDESAKWLEADAARAELGKRFGLPVTQLSDEEDGHGGSKSRIEELVGDATRKVARGRSPWTAFFAFAGVLGAVATIAAVLMAIALTIYFVAG